MLDSLKKHITSINGDELVDLCESYLMEDKGHDIDNFVTHLFNKKMITTSEYKNIQSQEQVALTGVEELEKQNSQFEKLKSSSGEDDYTILESIDEGAMGEILLARDNKLHRIVAYKKIHPRIAEIPSYLGRFFMEAQVTAQLQHPSIVPVYGLMVTDDIVGYAMKLINGITLKGLIRETQQQYDEHGEPDEHHTLHARLEHFLKVCDAMHYAHRKGVVHRDLKPLNIMIGPYNEVYVMDWGIAKIVKVDEGTFEGVTQKVSSDEVEREMDKTAIGQVMGTPPYMSPEQASGEHDILDHRSDLYSLGLILFELVTLYRAINGKDADEIMMKARRGIIEKPPVDKNQADEQEQLLAIVKKSNRIYA